jgi:hypothetical protein
MVSVRNINKLTLREMMINFDLYKGLPDGLAELPLPEKIKIKGRSFQIPARLDEFTENLCYGQRLFLVRKEDNDFGIIIRLIDGYYYTLVTSEKWDEEKALLFGKLVINCSVIELYPVAMHLTILVSQMAEREKSLLYREPTKLQLAAGIEKLNVFAELNALDFLAQAMRITVPEVLLTPYKECLVRFMIAKETQEFQDRYVELLKEVHEPKSKYKNEKVLRS